MALLSPQTLKRLVQNGLHREQDHVPVVKLFNPCGAATWLFTELGGDEDELFGLCDLGLGFPELGYASLRELESIRCPPFGLPLKVDEHFRARHPLSVYARAARQLDRITTDSAVLDELAAK